MSTLSADVADATDPPTPADEQAELVRTVAEAGLGFSTLRDGQLEAITAALDGRDVLAVMPTGSGKSAIYQLAGALVDGCVVVISPLLALQRDQLDTLDDRFGGAAVLNSTLSAKDYGDALDQLDAGERRFVFLAPEQLQNDRTRQRLADIGIALLVVDEAHCIVSWGHDFRPAYLRLGEGRAALGNPPVLALTATASAPVRSGIMTELCMQDPLVITGGVVRPNISLEVVTSADIDTARDHLVDRVGATPGTGLVYVATRAGAEALADTLKTDEREALPYHAGLPAGERTAVEARFGEANPVVVVATTAFGMGIDVPHVRFVMHLESPASLDDYYQEFGRAGRDDRPAAAVLFRTLDKATSRRMEGGTTHVEQATIDRVARTLAQVDRPVEVSAIAEDLELTTTRLATVLGHLTRNGAIAAASAGTAVEWTSEVTVEAAVEDAAADQQRSEVLARTQVEMMRQYLDAGTCRWRAIGAYFGQSDVDACQNCDICLASDEQPANTQPAGEADDQADQHGLAVGMTVTHTEFGTGQVSGVEGRKVMVLFDEGGYRTLAADVAMDGDLLTIADDEG